MTHNSSANSNASLSKKPEDADMYMKGLPKALRDYLRYDSPVFWSPRAVYKAYRRHGIEPTLRMLKAVACDESLATYGDNYVQIKGVHI